MNMHVGDTDTEFEDPEPHVPTSQRAGASSAARRGPDELGLSSQHRKVKGAHVV